MKKKKMPIIIVLFLVFLIAYQYAGLDTFLISILTKEKTPKEYADYKNLSDIKDFGTHHIVGLIAEGQDSSPPLCIYEISENEIVLHSFTG